MKETPEKELERVLKIVEIQKQIEQLHLDEANAKKQYDDVIKCIQVKMAKAQKECPHIWKHYPDASGNNDSCDVCLVCGKEE